jgi:LPXTG-motif cell wall-anchored protein
MRNTRESTNGQPTLRRRIVATAMAIGVVGFGVAVAPGVVSAHHPILSGTTSCRTDAWTVTWTATSDADRNLTWSITAPSGYSPSGFQDDQTAFTRTATYPGTQASAVESVTAEWSNSKTASATATVDRPPLCEAATTTTTTPTATTPTTTLPETTTTTATTIAPETATSVAEDDMTTTTAPVATTTTSVSQAGPTSTVGQSAAASTTTVGGNGQLPATGSGSLSLTTIALTLIGIGAVMLRLSSKPTR